MNRSEMGQESHVIEFICYDYKAFILHQVEPSSRFESSCGEKVFELFAYDSCLELFLNVLKLSYFHKILSVGIFDHPGFHIRKGIFQFLSQNHEVKMSWEKHFMNCHTIEVFWFNFSIY